MTFWEETGVSPDVVHMTAKTNAPTSRRSRESGNPGLHRDLSCRHERHRIDAPCRRDGDNDGNDIEALPLRRCSPQQR
ncbi:hypothetical protein [Lysobacter enzymogenes]|uniref:hypothetical protein n=1 Tax=Lysobacter enzymogenes TaxID=69 RepID=UPI0011AB44E7|nr:hypothetical protein [Lysobacter enzymogenes]